MSIRIRPGESEIEFRTRLAMQEAQDYLNMLSAKDSAYDVYGLIYTRQQAKAWAKIAELEQERREGTLESDAE